MEEMVEVAGNNTTETIGVRFAMTMSYKTAGQFGI
jgi:hypothetical protein